MITDLNTQIKALYPDFKGSYLYGSVARGENTPESDIDLVALFDTVDRDKELEVYGIVSDMLYKYDVFVELFVYTLASLRKNPVFYREVVDRGQFYAA